MVAFRRRQPSSAWRGGVGRCEKGRGQAIETKSAFRHFYGRLTQLPLRFQTSNGNQLDEEAPKPPRQRDYASELSSLPDNFAPAGQQAQISVTGGII